MRRLLSRTSAATLAAVAALAVMPPAAPARADRVDRLLAALTLDEKVALLHGAEDPLTAAGSPDQRGAGYLPGVPRLGIPPLRLADGPAGIRTARPATALPAPLALAASFDAALARRYGQVLGREALANNQDIVLGPMVNIARVPEAGRNFESFGEDPRLAGRIAAAMVDGIQAEGAIATVKHLAANNQEDHRQAVDARIDPRTMREIYLPAFAAASAAGAVMCGYNKVNGLPACESGPLLDGLLRGELGFRGLVMSDWGATHSTLPSLTAGLDLEMWSGRRYGGLAGLVRAGTLPEAALDRPVRRILAVLDRAGRLDGPRPRPAVDRAAHRRLALEAATAGAVLLRNEGGLLPLPADGSVLLVGPAAAIPLTGGNGSSRVPAPDAVGPLAALRLRHAGPVDHVPGIELDGEPIPGSALRRLDGSPAPLDLTLPPAAIRRWVLRLTSPVSGPVELRLQAGPLGQDVASPWRRGGWASLRLDGFTVATAGGVFGGDASLLPTADGLGNAAAALRLEAGVAHRITVTAEAGPDTPFRLRLAWVTPELRQRRLDQAVAAARRADSVVVFAHDEAGEGRDRASLGLPHGQNGLIAAIAAANPRTAIVLNTAGPVLMPWLERTGAVLQLWYPGLAGGEAGAALLTGAASPSGRLPMTFPADPRHMPTSPPERYPGRDGVADHAEGILVGYRWYDAQDRAPLFPFGHGLTYAPVAYRQLEVGVDGDGLAASFTLHNEGRAATAEVAQLYVGPPAEGVPVPMAPRSLADFTRVELAPGERRRVTLRADQRILSFWSPTQGWQLAAGRRPVWVGRSSRDLPLAGSVLLPR